MSLVKKEIQNAVRAEFNRKVQTRSLEGLVLNLLGQDSPQLRAHARAPERDTMNTFTLNDIYTY